MTIGKPGKLSLYLELIRWNRPAGWLLLWPITILTGTSSAPPSGQ